MEGGSPMRIKKITRIITAESRKWVDAGIITTDQQKRILTSYPPITGAKHHINLPAVIIALATLCISAGLLIFYAANWRKMPPPIRFMQIIILLCITYIPAYFFLAKDRGSSLGRALLVLGMVSFGAGIMLVAQLYHISAHPTNGLLVWAIGVFLMAALMKERWGLFLAAGLFLIWHQWELYQFSNPGYVYFLFIVLSAAAFAILKDKIGLAVSFIMFIIFYYQVNDFWLTHNLNTSSSGSAFLFTHIPAGLTLIAFSQLLKRNNSINAPATLIETTGWVFIAVPLFASAWPFTIAGLSPLFLFGNSAVFSAEYIILLAPACIIFVLLMAGKKLSTDLIILLIYALAAFFLPLGSTTVRMIFLHLTIIILTAKLLYLPHISKNNFRRIIGLIFVTGILLVKFFGFAFYAFDHNEYRAAYLIGFIIFGTVIFLLQQSIAALQKKNTDTARGTLIYAFCAVLAFAAMYLLSFKMPAQKSVFNADTVVMVMIFLFSGIALLLFLHLIRSSERTLLTILSAIIFTASWITLLLAGMTMPWQLYSAVFNIMLLIFSGTLIYYSTVIQSKILLNIAISGFLLHIGTRYFDLFWDMLSGSALFIITGIVGLAGGYFLERKRRDIIRTMNNTGKNGESAL